RLMDEEESLRKYTDALARIAISLLILPALVLGQGDQGRIGGTVKDTSGAVIPGVTVTAKNERTGEERTTITGDRGDFLIAALKPSNYTVTTALRGFSATTVPDLQLVVGNTINLDLTIKPAGISESVTVEALSQALVDTTSASVGVNV